MPRTWLLGIVLLTALGCGKAGPKIYQVNGTVRWKGQSVEQGDVVLVPLDRHARAEGCKLVDGKFSVRCEAGKKKIEIYARRLVPGKQDPVMGGPLYEPLIPPEFNAQTKLEAEVQPHDENVMDFVLPTAR